MTREEAQAKLKSILGAEFVFENEHFSTIATVVAADIDKGISIKGVIPGHCCRAYGTGPEEEAVLVCRSLSGPYVESPEDFIKGIAPIFDAVESGFYLSRPFSGGKSVPKTGQMMAMSCPFS